MPRMDEINCVEKSMWPGCKRVLTLMVLIFTYKFYFKKRKRKRKQLGWSLANFFQDAILLWLSLILGHAEAGEPQIHLTTHGKLVILKSDWWKQNQFTYSHLSFACYDYIHPLISSLCNPFHVSDKHCNRHWKRKDEQGR